MGPAVSLNYGSALAQFLEGPLYFLFGVMTALSEKFRPPSLALARIGIGRRLDCLDPDGVRGRGNQMASERASVSRPSAQVPKA